MVKKLLQFFKGVLHMSEQSGVGSGEARTDRSSQQQAARVLSDQRINDHARLVLESVHTRPSEVTIGMIKQTNGHVDPPR